MTKLPSEYLERQPEEVSRILVLSFLDDALAAAERLGNPHDNGALHDFRVALRRLRSCIRDYRPYLKNNIPKKVRKELRSLASSTNAARDAEVQLAWLNAQSDKLNEREHNGFAWLVERLDEKDAEPHPERFERVTAQLARIRKILSKNLSSFRVYLDATTRRDPFKAVVGSLIQKQVGSLIAQLREIRTAEDNSQAHAARISAKRLRYLMEPISEAVPEVTPLVERLKELQNSLGDLHDTNLLISKIGTAMEASAIEGARRLHLQALQPANASSAEETPGTADQGEQPGLLALARLLQNRRQILFSEINSRWRGSGLDRFVAEAHELGGRLRASPGNEPRVRRFRLTGLPERLQNQSSTLVDEGWLPGKEIEDCVRRERSEGTVRHYRLVRVGSETKRTRISRRVFASLWPLTNGRRLQKSRYEVTEGDRIWRVDDLGGNVVLAETEATPGDEELRLPDWLIPCLREELTGSTKPSPPAAARTKSRTKQTAIGKVDESPAPDVPPAQRGSNPESYPKTIPDNGRRNNGSTRSSPNVPEPPAEPEGQG